MMIKFITKFKYIYVLLYGLVLYNFFVTLSFKEHFLRRCTSSDSDKNQLINVISTSDEKKLFLDLKYKKQVHTAITKKFTEDLIFIDNESKIIGYKSISSQDHLSTKFSVYLNKKFLHSFLYGSIKFIQL
jgi:hypothetical protein